MIRSSGKEWREVLPVLPWPLKLDDGLPSWQIQRASEALSAVDGTTIAEIDQPGFTLYQVSY